MAVLVVANPCLGQFRIVRPGRCKPSAAANQDPTDYSEDPSDNLVAVDHYRR
jgi:hypothetical protein